MHLSQFNLDGAATAGRAAPDMAGRAAPPTPGWLRRPRWGWLRHLCQDGRAGIAGRGMATSGIAGAGERRARGAPLPLAGRGGGAPPRWPREQGEGAPPPLSGRGGTWRIGRDCDGATQGNEAAALGGGGPLEGRRRAGGGGWAEKARKQSVARGRNRMTKMKRYVHNQWQVGNFCAQKPVKAGGKVLLDLY